MYRKFAQNTCRGLDIPPLLTTTSSKAMAVSLCSTTASSMFLLTSGSSFLRAAITRSFAS